MVLSLNPLLVPKVPKQNSTAFGKAPQREANSQPISQSSSQSGSQSGSQSAKQAGSQSVRQSVGQAGRQVETHSLAFFQLRTMITNVGNP